MNETKEGISRRSFLAILGIGATAVAIKKIVDVISDTKHDLSNPENFKEFVGKEAYLVYFKGDVDVKEGATLHSRPTYFRKEGEKFPFTTPLGGETKIALINKGEKFQVSSPILIFQEADEGKDNFYIKDINLPDGTSKKIDTRGSWAIFGVGLSKNMPQEVKKDIENTEYKVACVNFTDLAFRPSGSSEEQSSFPSDSIEYRQVIELGVGK